MDGNRLGTAIAGAIIASRPAPGHKITDGELEAMWQLVGVEIVAEIVNFSEVIPTALIDSLAGPVTGTGENI